MFQLRSVPVLLVVVGKFYSSIIVLTRNGNFGNVPQLNSVWAICFISNFHFCCLLLFTTLAIYLLIRDCLLFPPPQWCLRRSRSHYFAGPLPQPSHSTTHLHSHNRTLVTSVSATVATPHAQCLRRNPLRLSICLICHFSQFSNNLRISFWSILEQREGVCLSFSFG